MLLVLVFAMIPFTVDAYTLVGGKWENPCITTHSVEIKSALNEWNKVSNVSYCGDGNQITFEVISDKEMVNRLGPGVLGYAGWTGTQTTITGCSVVVRESSKNNLGVLVHEVGHCLGIGHSQDKYANMAPYCCNPINQDDINAIELLYGKKIPVVKFYRYQLPFVARD